MVDLSKLPWDELKLPGGLVASLRRSALPDFPAIFMKSPVSMLAWKDSDRWRMSSMDAVVAEDVLAATKLVDAFIEEHSKPKVPDVVPPDTYEWHHNGNQWVMTNIKRRPDFQPAFIPRNGPERDAMLACCEAFDRENNGASKVVEFGRSEQADVFRIVIVPSGLQPGRYAVSFRRLP